MSTVPTRSIGNEATMTARVATKAPVTPTA